MPNELTKTVIAEFMSIIGDAPLFELRAVEADYKAKKQGRPKVSIQGMILDAMDDARLEGVEAHRLLCLVNQRINGNSEGLCRITPDGDVMAMGSVIQGGE